MTITKGVGVVHIYWADQQVCERYPSGKVLHVTCMLHATYMHVVQNMHVACMLHAVLFH